MPPNEKKGWVGGKEDVYSHKHSSQIIKLPASSAISACWPAIHCLSFLGHSLAFPMFCVGLPDCTHNVHCHVCLFFVACPISCMGLLCTKKVVIKRSKRRRVLTKNDSNESRVIRDPREAGSPWRHHIHTRLERVLLRTVLTWIFTLFPSYWYYVYVKFYVATLTKGVVSILFQRVLCRKCGKTTLFSPCRNA